MHFIPSSILKGCDASSDVSLHTCTLLRDGGFFREAEVNVELGTNSVYHFLSAPALLLGRLMGRNSCFGVRRSHRTQTPHCAKEATERSSWLLLSWVFTTPSSVLAHRLPREGSFQAPFRFPASPVTRLPSTSDGDNAPLFLLSALSLQIMEDQCYGCWQRVCWGTRHPVSLLLDLRVFSSA